MGTLQPYTPKGPSGSLSSIVEDYEIPLHLRNNWKDVQISFPFYNKDFLEVKLVSGSDEAMMSLPGIFPHKNLEFPDKRLSGRFDRLVPTTASPYEMERFSTPASAFEVLDEMLDDNIRYLRFASLLCLNLWLEIKLDTRKEGRRLARMQVEELVDPYSVQTRRVCPALNILRDPVADTRILVVREETHSNLILLYRL